MYKVGRNILLSICLLFAGHSYSDSNIFAPAQMYCKVECPDNSQSVYNFSIPDIRSSSSISHSMECNSDKSEKIELNVITRMEENKIVSIGLIAAKWGDALSPELLTARGVEVFLE